MRALRALATQRWIILRRRYYRGMHYYVSVTYEVQYPNYDKYRQRYGTLGIVCERYVR